MARAARTADVADIADEGLIHLHDLASAAQRGKLADPHCLADAVRQEPCTFVSDFQNAVHLVRRNALLAGRHEMHGLQALVQRDMGGLKHGADAYGELLPAVIALPQAKSGLAALPYDALQPAGAINGAAMRAHNAASP